MKASTFSLILLAATFLADVVIAAPSNQDRKEEAHIVQADDWLSKIADKFYDNVLAYPAIVEATNTKAAVDDSFTAIDNLDVIEIGQKLRIPAQIDAIQVALARRSDVTGIYKGFSSAASSPGIDSTIYLNVDQTFKEVSYYFDGESPIVEVGTWELNETGQIVAIITGQEDRVYYTPQTMILTPQAEQLHLMADKYYSQTWVRLDALATQRQQLPYDSFTANREVRNHGFEGIYKAFAPSASCCGQDFTLILNSKNTVQLTTNFHKGDPEIIEVGVWQADEDDRLTVTLTGQQERTYDTPRMSKLAWGDGQLTVIEAGPAGFGSEGLVFYHTFAIHMAQALKAGGDEAITYYLQRSLGQSPDVVNLWAVELINTRLQALLEEQYDRFVQNMTTPGVVSKEESVFYVLGQGDEGQAIFLLDEANNTIEVKLLSDQDMAEYNEGGQEIQNLPTDVTTAIANWQNTHGQ